MLELKTNFILTALLTFTLLQGCMARPADHGRDSKPTDSASADPMTIEVIPQFDPIMAGVARDLYVLVRLKAKAGGMSSSKRPPLDLAVVLDRSGSMSGQKLDDAKRAALDLIGQLSEKDRVTLVVYDTDVDVLAKRRAVDPAGRESLRNQLLKVQAGSNTALGPALYQALEILEPAERSEKDIAHVMLLSDGLANEGEKRPEMLSARAKQGFSRGVSVSTLGVGLDYNEGLMTQIADEGGGDYYFIKNSDAIPGILKDELAGLSETLARSVVLEFELEPGLAVSRVFGYAASTENQRTRVLVGAMRAGQAREILLRLSVPSTHQAEQSLGNFGVRFRDVSREGQEVARFQPVAVKTTEQSEEVRRGERNEVTVRVAEAESADSLEAAVQAVNKGDYQGAKKILQDSKQEMQTKAKLTPSPRLDKQVEELEKAQIGVDKAQSDSTMRKSFEKENRAYKYRMMK